MNTSNQRRQNGNRSRNGSKSANGNKHGSMDSKSNRGKRSNKNARSGTANKPSTRSQSRSNKSNSAKTNKEGQVAKKILKVLNSKYQMNIRPKSDRYIIDSITGKYQNDITYWKANMLRLGRSAACLGTKLKTDNPVKSLDELQSDFLETQVDPIFSPMVANAVQYTIARMMKGFPYEKVRKEALSQDRDRVITQGSAWPALPAPVNIDGDKSNVELLIVMSGGLEAFDDPEFHVSKWIAAPADCKFSAVQKNWKTFRGISITQRELMDPQIIIANHLRDWLTTWSRTSNHIIQFDDQTVQHSFLREGYATVDLSSASDRVYKTVIQAVWPEFMEYFGDFLPKDIMMTNGSIHELKCVGTQGFPLTFVVMAMLVGAVCATFKTSTLPTGNFGDDAAIAQKDYPEVYNALHSLGMVVNKDKTFTSSMGFLESCGRDVRIKNGGISDITPLHLRGEKDIHIIQFFTQMCDERNSVIPVQDAKDIMDELGVEYYAFKWEHQITEFHFPYGEPYKLGKPIWDLDGKGYMVKVPYMESKIDQIKGLSKSDSSVLIELLEINSGLKEPNINEKHRKGVDMFAQPHRKNDLMASKFYSLYQAIEKAQGDVLLSIKLLSTDYKVSDKVIAFYLFITQEMQKYKFSTTNEDFSLFTVKDIKFSDVIDNLFGINPEQVYPIFRYKTQKGSKLIIDPRSVDRLEIN